MLSRNHLITNTASLCGIIGSFVWCSGSLPVLGQPIVRQSFTQFFTFINPVQGEPDIVTVFVCYLLFLFGTLLPDIDSPDSLIGRFVYIPIEHRTWTHTIWFVAVFFVGGYHIIWFVWIGLGYLFHLFWDNLSVCGVCFFYPFSNYIKYDNGAKIKKNHVGFYHTGEQSENNIVILSVFLSICCVTFGIQTILATPAF